MNLPRKLPLNLAAVILGGLCLTGCAAASRPPDAQAREAIRRRTGVSFRHAILLKPRESAAFNTYVAMIAPLIVSEVASTNIIDVRRASFPELAFSDDEVMVDGKAHRQVSFVWRQQGLKPQGVRIMFNLVGLPVVWEVVEEGAHASVVFVSKALEAAAMREFGPPLPGRNFSVERAVDQAPDVVVARVNDDAPVPMGPIVHLDAHGKVTTVNCRCMPTQAQQLVGTAFYELRSLEGCSQQTAIRAQLTNRTRFPATDKPSGVERCLRLPKQF